MTIREFIEELLWIDNKDEVITSIGAYCGTDRPAEYSICTDRAKYDIGKKQKVIIRSELYLGNQEGNTVHKYKENRVKEMALEELHLLRDIAKEEIENEDDIEDAIENNANDITIVTKQRTICYETVELEK